MARKKGLQNFNLSLIRYQKREQNKGTTQLAAKNRSHARTSIPCFEPSSPPFGGHWQEVVWCSRCLVGRYPKA